MAKKTPTSMQAAADMATAHSDLTIFAGVIRLMEGGLLSSDSQSDEFKIIAAANAAERRAYRRYALAEAVLMRKPE